MLRKIYHELVLIRKELQAIRSSKESKVTVTADVDGKEMAKIVRTAIHDRDARLQEYLVICR